MAFAGSMNNGRMCHIQNRRFNTHVAYRYFTGSMNNDSNQVSHPNRRLLPPAFFGRGSTSYSSYFVSRPVTVLIVLHKLAKDF